jgi:hypothetical protein
MFLIGNDAILCQTVELQLKFPFSPGQTSKQKCRRKRNKHGNTQVFMTD